MSFIHRIKTQAANQMALLWYDFLVEVLLTQRAAPMLMLIRTLGQHCEPGQTGYKTYHPPAACFIAPSAQTSWLPTSGTQLLLCPLSSFRVRIENLTSPQATVTTIAASRGQQ